MKSTLSSYLTYLVTVLMILYVSSNLLAQEIYLEPNPVYLNGSIGQEFQLELKVDAATQGIRLYQVFIKYEPNLLDTVSFALGPLFDNSGFGSFFSTKIVYDTVTQDSLLRVEALLLGASAVVDGPGIVAYINLKSNSQGIADLSILRHVMTDIANDTIVSTSVGTIAYLHTPPDSFNLISPIEGENIIRDPGDLVTFTWESSQSVFPGEGVNYDFQYSSDVSFTPGATTSHLGLTDTTIDISADDLSSGELYWRVIANGNIYSYVQPSTPFPAMFNFTYTAQPPLSFGLNLPANNNKRNINGTAEQLFDWEDALGTNPSDIINYTFYLDTQPLFSPTSQIVIEVGLTSEVSIINESLPYCTEIYWNVVATNQYDLSTWADAFHTNTFYRKGDWNCSNGGVPIDITDLTKLVDYMFAGADAPAFLEIGDLDCSGGGSPIGISDLTMLVDYLFGGGMIPSCN